MDYKTHLSTDKKLAKFINGHETFELKFHRNICLRLCASIMSQQLSTKVAKVIGLSNAKTQYVLNVAEFAITHKLADQKLKKLSNEEIIELLTRIKGVGKWTVEMLLMFTLGREDVFAVDDYGIQVAMKKIYKIDDSNKKAFKDKMIRISEKWSPYRTYACLHLWHYKDNAPAPVSKK